MTDTTLASTLSRLYRLRATDIKFGLDTEKAIMNRLGNPERAWPSLHVAGTNGKGSVCAILESVLRHAGFITGLYTSPHLVRFNERIRVNGRDIADNDLADLICRAEDAAANAAGEPEGRDATFFELATAMAFDYFRRSNIDIAVIETGLGGRLDATNVISPLVSVITSISLEHVAWLGNDIAEIAREKSGIIKPGIPVVIGDLPSEAVAVVESVASGQGSRVIRAHEILSVQQLKQDPDGIKIKVESDSISYGTLFVPMPGAKTASNIGVAIAALETLFSVLSADISIEVIKKGLKHIRWPGRFHIVARNPFIIADGAHNPEAAGSLAHSLRLIFPDIPVGLVFGIAEDKDVAGVLGCFTGIAERCWAVPLRSDRGMAPSDILRKAKTLGLSASRASLPSALEQAVKWAEETGGIVCITGSLFLVGEVLELTMQSGLKDDSALNRVL